MKPGVTIEYLKYSADLKFEVDFGVNGAIGTNVTKFCVTTIFSVGSGLRHDSSYVVDSSYVGDYSFRNDASCPTLSGREEAVQLEKFWRLLKDITDPNLDILDMARNMSFTYLSNPALMGYHAVHLRVNIESLTIVMSASRGYNVRVVLQETNEDAPTIGGSTFYATVRSVHTRMPCATRDYFNGTYLMCCSLMEDYSNITIIHEHLRFTAYELSKRHIHKQIYTDILNTPRGPAELVRQDQTGCYDVDMASPSGYWVLQDQWEWVVDGCKMHILTPDEANECFEERYNHQLTSMGDSHLRNLYYYTVTYVDPSYINRQKVHRNMRWHNYRYIWTTNALTLIQDLEEYAHTVQYKNKLMVRDAWNIKPQHLLYVDMGVWQVQTRPLFDYVNSMYVLIPLLKRLQMMGVNIIWQNMPSNPTAKWDREYTEHELRAKRSNAVVGALNYIICQMLDKIDIKCVPNWLHTIAWKDELICSGIAHTMCALPDGVMDVTPPGWVTSHQALLQACPRDRTQFLRHLEQHHGTNGIGSEFHRFNDVSNG